MGPKATFAFTTFQSSTLGIQTEASLHLKNSETTPDGVFILI